jgi:hypothetical protein
VFSDIICWFLILAWCEFVCCGDLCDLVVLAYLYRYYFSPLDLNDTECTKEGEVFEYQGEDQGQAEKGKPST